MATSREASKEDKASYEYSSVGHELAPFVARRMDDSFAVLGAVELMVIVAVTALVPVMLTKPGTLYLVCARIV
jgi:hypothetical protein